MRARTPHGSLPRWQLHHPANLFRVNNPTRWIFLLLRYTQGILSGLPFNGLDSAGGQASRAFSVPSLSAVLAGLVTSCDDLMTILSESSTRLTCHLQTGDDLASEHGAAGRNLQQFNLTLEDVLTLCQDRENLRNKMAHVGSTSLSHEI